MTKLSTRVKRIKPSATLAITAKANALKQQGINIISMASGEPDFDTPDHIKKAAVDAIYAGKTRYTAVDGTPSLKEAIIQKFKRDNQLDYALDEIIVSSGGKQVFSNLCQAFLNPNDEVIIPAPYWVSYPDMVLLAGAKPVVVKTSLKNNFKITPKDLEKVITIKTKLLIINSPSNPTGAVYSKKELQDLARVIEKYPDIFIMSDDIYEHIYWHSQPFINTAMLSETLKARTIILNGVSKSYAMTGWRIGFGAGDKNIIAAMKKIQSQSTSNACSISQAAAEVALNAKQDFIKKIAHEFKKRHAYIYKSLNEIEGITCPKAEGAFYAFAKVSSLITKLRLGDDIDLASFLLDKLKIAIVPGSAFGAKNHIRFSFATSMDNIKKTIERLQTL